LSERREEPDRDSVDDETMATRGASKGLTYADAGVDITAGEDAVRRIKEHVRSTYRPEVIGDIGGFGGMFAFPKDRFRDPVLVASTDGVGTKALIAKAAGRFNTIGIDLVAMCVDDLVCQGAEPLFFLDYIAVGKLDPDHIDELVSGVAEGCRQAGCALIGGEMAEHPGAMDPGEFDLVGMAVGVVERDRIITGEHVRPGDVLVGLPSPGLRSNGYSLARKAFFDVAGRDLDDPVYDGSRRTLADELLEPSVIYAPAISALLRAVDVRGVAHITGGGIIGNLARVLPKSADAVVDRGSWEPPRIFDEIASIGGITPDEMARTFNMGLGMIVVVPRSDVFKTLDILRSRGHRGAAEVGEVVDGHGAVLFEG
jgi:phosphoribosylformylglycinamidine cyclo-ligase